MLISCSQVEMLTPKKVTKVEESPAPETPVKQVYSTKTKENSPAVKKYCEKIDSEFAKYNWGNSECDTFTWHHVRSSHLGNPIIWFTFGEEKSHLPSDEVNTTMILCGVHGDEITPIKFCFDLLNDLKLNTDLFVGKQVIVAPIVTPDSFFGNNPSRTNARGVDINRNFPTDDWQAKAHYYWINRYGKDKRRYPGKYAMSEQETLFQVNLINRYKPDKVISVHAPLTLLDYDGPAFSKELGQSAKQLLVQMSDHAGKYKISNYPFFPGSLGNWAGNERKIPTYTLELPNSDWTKTDKFYRMFKNAIHHAIEHTLSPNVIKKKYSKN